MKVDVSENSYSMFEESHLLKLPSAPVASVGMKLQLMYLTKGEGMWYQHHEIHSA